MPTATYSFHFAALWHLCMQISGDKTTQFSIRQNLFAAANALVSFGRTEIRTGSVPKAQSRAQGPIFWLWHLHGTAALVVHDDASHITVWWSTISPTAVDQHGRLNKCKNNFKRMAKFTTWSRCGNASGFSQKTTEAPLLLGCNRWPLLQIFNHVFLGVRQTRVLYGPGISRSTHSM